MTRLRPLDSAWRWLIRRVCLDLAAADLDLMARTFPRRP